LGFWVWCNCSFWLWSCTIFLTSCSSKGSFIIPFTRHISTINFLVWLKMQPTNLLM
jgi:hypothetical protein